MMFILAHWTAGSRPPICVNWTFFAKCYGWGTMGENSPKIGIQQGVGSVSAKFAGRRGHPLPIISARI